MKLVAAKCTNCGGILEVDGDQDAAVCKYCKTPFIVEKAVENYNITNNYTTVNNISGQEIHIHQDGETPEKLFENFKALIARGDFSLAEQTLTKLNEKYPSDYRVDEAVVYRYINTVDWDNAAKHFDDTFFTAFKNLRNSNRSVYDSYYRELPKKVNAILNEKTNCNFSGGMLNTKLTMLKELYDLKGSTRNCLIYHMGWLSLGDFHSDGKETLPDSADIDLDDEEVLLAFFDVCNEPFIWDERHEGVRDLLKAIQNDREREDVDDDYIIYMIPEIEEAIEWSGSLDIEMSEPWNFRNDRREYGDDWKPRLESRISAMKNIREELQKSMTANGKKKYDAEQERKRIEERKEDLERRWGQYLEDLNKKKSKSAYDRLSYIGGAVAQEELAKFKKGMLGVKYLGDVKAISVEELVRRSLEAEGIKS